MDRKIKEKVFDEQVNQMLTRNNKPILFKKRISGKWPCSEWSEKSWSKALNGIKLTFRVHKRKVKGQHEASVQWENQPEGRVTATMAELLKWQDDQPSGSGLDDFPKSDFWVYSAYNYVNQLVQPTTPTTPLTYGYDLTNLTGSTGDNNRNRTTKPADDPDDPNVSPCGKRRKLEDQQQHHSVQLSSPLLTAFDWSALGFGLDSKPDGSDSTFWLGSEGALTPCHRDSYGYNLVVQLLGRKRWLLFPPADQEFLYPTRLPYEESSLFSSVNMASPDLDTHPKLISAHPHLVTLGPGDMLYVPHHWWHYVQCVPENNSQEAGEGGAASGLSLSVNSWRPLPDSDPVDQLEEAVTRALATALIPIYQPVNCNWINASPVYDNGNNSRQVTDDNELDPREAGQLLTMAIENLKRLATRKRSDDREAQLLALSAKLAPPSLSSLGDNAASLLFKRNQTKPKEKGKEEEKGHQKEVEVEEEESGGDDDMKELAGGAVDTSEASFIKEASWPDLAAELGWRPITSNRNKNSIITRQALLGNNSYKGVASFDDQISGQVNRLLTKINQQSEQLENNKLLPPSGNSPSGQGVGFSCEKHNLLLDLVDLAGNDNLDQIDRDNLTSNVNCDLNQSEVDMSKSQVEVSLEKLVNCALHPEVISLIVEKLVSSLS